MEGAVFFFILIMVGSFPAHTGSQQYDYIVGPSVGNYMQARSFCKNQGYTLAIANSSVLQREIADVAFDVSFPHVWLNANETIYPWAWNGDLNAGIEHDQGCFTTTAINHFESADITGMSKQNCIDLCIGGGYKLAGLLKLGDTAGECRCGNSLSLGGVSNIQHCEAVCPGDDPQSVQSSNVGYCGDQTQNIMYYRVLAVNGRISFGYEHDSVIDDYLCGTIIWRKYSGYNDIFAMKKERCTMSRGYICYTSEELPDCAYFLSDGGCMWVVDTPTTDWFAARQLCMDRKGDLAFIDEDIAKELRDDTKITSGIYYWVGLRGSQWLWDEDPSKPLAFSSWGADEPSSSSDNCVAMDTNSVRWIDVPCSANYHYICLKEKPSTPTPSSPPISSTTRGPSEPTAPRTNVPEYTETPQPSTALTTEPLINTSAGPTGETGAWTIGMIVGVSVGAVVAVILLISAIFLGRKVLKSSEKQEATTERRAKLDGQINNAFASISQLNISTLPDVHPNGASNTPSNRISTETMPSGAQKNKDGSYNNPGFTHQSSIPDDYPHGTYEVEAYRNNNMENESRIRPDQSQMPPPNNHYYNVPVAATRDSTSSV